MANAFAGKNITSVTIPNTVDWIGEYAFSECTNLTSISIPNSVIWIGDYAFSFCNSLFSVSISTSATRIGHKAFYNCNNLKSISIPKSVTEIGIDAFGIYRNDLHELKKVQGFTISGYYGTEAEGYAKENGITFNGTKSSLFDVVDVEYDDYRVYDYTGKEIKPDIAVGYKESNVRRLLGELKEGIDYTVSYSNNIYAGVATIIITGINHFKDSIEKTFIIHGTDQWSRPILNQTTTVTITVKPEKVTIPKTPASVKAKAKKNKVTVSWKKIKKSKKIKALLTQIQSIELQYCTDPSFPADISVKIPLGKKKTKFVLKGLQKGTAYYMRVRYTDGAGGYSAWSGVKRVVVK